MNHIEEICLLLYKKFIALFKLENQWLVLVSDILDDDFEFRIFVFDLEKRSFELLYISTEHIDGVLFGMDEFYFFLLLFVYTLLVPEFVSFKQMVVSESLCLKCMLKLQFLYFDYPFELCNFMIFCVILTQYGIF